MKFTIVYSILVFCLSGKLVLSSSESGTPIHAGQTANTNTNTTTAIKDAEIPPQPPHTNITTEPITQSTTSAPPPTTSATPTTKPTTVPTTTRPTTTTPLPTTPPPTTPPPTTPPPTTPSPTTPSTVPTTTVAPSTTPSPAPDRKFDSPSFIGGFVLCMGLTAIAFISFKFYKARTERNYHTL